MNYFLAPALETLRNQINKAYPTRDKRSDGWIGDSSHQARKSDHNPDSTGMVCALDITHDPKVGLSADALSDALYGTRDRRIAYVIANRLITTPSGTGSGNYGPWVPYGGADPHTQHIHLSVLHGSYGMDSSKWNLSISGVTKPKPVVVPPPPKPSANNGHPVPSVIAKGTDDYFGSISGPNESHGGFNASEQRFVKMIQQKLISLGFVQGITNPNSGWADGIFDTRRDRPGTGATSMAVERFQRKFMPNTTFFGQVWWDDWTKLFSL